MQHLVPCACPVPVPLGRRCLEVGTQAECLMPCSLTYLPSLIQPRGWAFLSASGGICPFCSASSSSRPGRRGGGEPGQASLPRAVASSGLRAAVGTLPLLARRSAHLWTSLWGCEEGAGHDEPNGCSFLTLTLTLAPKPPAWL